MITLKLKVTKNEIEKKFKYRKINKRDRNETHFVRNFQFT